MKKSTLQVAFALAFGVAAMSAQAAVLNNGDVLTITAGVPSFDTYGNLTQVSTGSYFGVDTDANSKIAGTEKTALSQGTTGIVIGATPPVGISHAGAPTGGDVGIVDAAWNFFGNTGTDYNTVPITGSTTAGLNMSGWTIAWAGISINMGGGAWGTGFSNGVGNLVWNGVYGSGYTMDYHATIPLGDPSGFGGCKYALHLTGSVSSVPVPAAAWLLGSGLFGMLGVAKRRRG